MHDKLSKNLSITVSFALGLILGVVATLVLGTRLPATFFHARLVEILQLLVVILGFTVFSYFVTKRYSDHQRRLDFLYDRVAALKDQLERDFSELQTSLAHFHTPETKKRVLMACRSLSNGVHTLHSATHPNDPARPHANSLKDYVEQMRQVLTGDDWDTVEELSGEQIQEAERVVRNVDSELDRFAVALFK